MVRRGKLSKGCQTCRKRKIKVTSPRIEPIDKGAETASVINFDLRAPSVSVLGGTVPNMEMRWIEYFRIKR